MYHLDIVTIGLKYSLRIIFPLGNVSQLFFHAAKCLKKTKLILSSVYITTRNGDAIIELSLHYHKSFRSHFFYYCIAININLDILSSFIY